MKKILFICNTNYQFIIACHIKLTFFQEDSAYIVLTDQTSVFQDVASNLHNESLYKQVFFIKTKLFCSRKETLRGYINDVKNCVFGRGIDLDFVCQYYDMVFYYNIDFFLISLMNRLKKINRHLILNKYEEGILCYNHKVDYMRLTVIKKINFLLSGNDVEKDTKNFFCFFPVLYKGAYRPVKIGKIIDGDNTLRDILNRAYGVHENDSVINTKYIFFTSIFDIEGGSPIGEYEAVSLIADRVGKENLLIKMHPRDSRDIYKKAGFLVEEKSDIPWEVLQFSTDISSKILLTVNSTAILSSALLFDKSADSWFVFKMCNIEKNQYAREAIYNIHKLFDDGTLSDFMNIKIMDHIEDIIG